MRVKKTAIILITLITVMFFTALLHAAVPKLINYQGKLTDKEDNPISGNYLVTFRFYGGETGGEPLWEEGHILPIKMGLFNVLLGSIKSLDVDFNKDLWLGLEIASDGEMMPRVKLASSAYALNAKSIDMITSEQLLRNDVDSIMAGSLTLKKDLILKGDMSGPSKLVLTDVRGSEYYLWIDSSGNFRIKQGNPIVDTDGSVIIKEKSGSLSTYLIQTLTLILLLVAIIILALILYSSRKK
jgi:hypothetical protein